MARVRRDRLACVRVLTDEDVYAVMTVACPQCGAAVLIPCAWGRGHRASVHQPRLVKAIRHRRAVGSDSPGPSSAGGDTGTR